MEEEKVVEEEKVSWFNWNKIVGASCFLTPVSTLFAMLATAGEIAGSLLFQVASCSSSVSEKRARACRGTARAEHEGHLTQALCQGGLHD